MEDFFVQHLGDLSARIADLGPIAVLLLLLLPLGEEVILIPAGVLIGHGSLPFLLTWLCAYIGVMVSDSLWFLVAHHYGTPLLHKRWFKRVAHPRRLLQAKHQIERRGAWVIVSGRFIPGSRTAAIVMSGMLHMPAWKFLVTESVMAACTTLFQLLLGMLIAHGVGSQDTAGRVVTVVAVVVLIIVGSFAFRWIMAHRRSGGPPPRAPAAWLRRFRRPRGAAARPAGESASDGGARAASAGPIPERRAPGLSPPRTN